MSYTLRTARVAYDNLAVGGAAGRERTILGATPSTEKFGGGSNIKRVDGGTSAMEASSEPTTANARDRILSSSGGVTTLHPRETMINTN